MRFGQNVVEIARFERPGFQRRALVHGAGRKQPVYCRRIGGFDPDLGQKLGSQSFGRPGGKHGPAQLAARVGQGGLNGMQPVKPLTAGRSVRAAAGTARGGTFLPFGLGCGRGAEGFSRLFRGFFAGSGALRPAWISGAHGALIKKWGQPVKLAGKIPGFLRVNGP